MHGLVVIEGMNLSGHPWIINEILRKPWLGQFVFEVLISQTTMV